MMLQNGTKPLKKLRVAICHPDLGLGGAERLIVDAAVELADRGHEVHVFTAHHDPKHCFKETLDGGFKVSVFGDFLPRHIFHHFHAICAYVRCCVLALYLVLSFPTFDAIIVDQVSAVIPILRLKRSAKILFYCHFPDLLLAQHSTGLRQLYRGPIDWVEQTTTGMADRVVVNSEFTASIFKETFSSLSANGMKPDVLYPAVNIQSPSSPSLSRVSRARSLSSGRGDGCVAGILELSDDTHYFLSINRFERKKNLELAIMAFAELLKRPLRGGVNHHRPVELAKKLKLVLAGGYDPRLVENREYLLELHQMAEAEGLEESVVFVPSFTDAQKIELLQNCICVVYTPQNEHFGIVPLEAMAARKAVVACDSGGPRETVQHQSTGFLCAPTPGAFATAMAELQYSSRAEVMGAAARRHVEGSFSRHLFGDRLEALLRDMLMPAKRD